MLHLLLFAAITTALAFALSSAGKATSLAAFERAISDLRLVPQRLIRPLALAVLAAESAVVALIVLGGLMPGTTLLRAGFLLALGLLVLFTTVLISTLARRLATSCACFGATTKPVSGWDVVRNGGLLLCSGVGYWSAGEPMAVLHPLSLAEWGLIAIVAVIFVLIWVQLAEIAQLFKPGVGAAATSMTEHGGSSDERDGSASQYGVAVGSGALQPIADAGARAPHQHSAPVSAERMAQGRRKSTRLHG